MTRTVDVSAMPRSATPPLLAIAVVAAAVASAFVPLLRARDAKLKQQRSRR